MRRPATAATAAPGCASSAGVHPAPAYALARDSDRARACAGGQVVDNLRENNLKVQEIRVMMHLKHRNIVEMCDFYTSNNQLCIVMEFADGGDLRNEVIKARNGKTTISEELISVWLIQASAPLTRSAASAAATARAHGPGPAAGVLSCEHICERS